MKRFMLAVLLVLAIAPGCGRTDKENVSGLPPGSEATIAVATDIHYLAPELSSDSEYFLGLISSADGKQTNYIEEIGDALVAEVIGLKPQALVLTGDLTYNGEKRSHEKLAQKLKAVLDAGIPVFVIPGNHDINNFNARSYATGAPGWTRRVTPEEFAKIYRDLGYGAARSRDEQSLSYCVALTPDLWLLMLDTCVYKDNNVSNPSDASGELGEETLAWLDNQLKEANLQGAKAITATHHNLFSHNRLFSSYAVKNGGQVAEVLASHGVPVNLSGHIHVQNIASQEVKNRTIYDIATSSLAVYTNQYGVLKVGSQLEYQSKELNMEAWATANGIADPNLLNFEAYSYKFFGNAGSGGFIERIKSLGISQEEAALAANAINEINARYFSGTLPIYRDEIMKSEGYKLLTNTGSFGGAYVDSLMNGPFMDNGRLVVDLGN
ncbi:MAG: metallophosphoesterase [Clostridiales bacterium]|jgi:3',5'-cyclic AMP phosphodiesterase CpdA|nr:metallophosphoesterase [Clostridiales bacterium]